MAAESGLGGDVVTPGGDSAVERVLAAVLYGDLLSVYLAVARGVDPTPVEPIEQLKQRLAASP
jgi:glucose/mannose-6-phosphate isomerase